MFNLWGEEDYNQENIYTYTYSLWEDSKYYDTKNLSPHSFGAKPPQFIEALTPLQLELRSSICPEPPTPAAEAPDIPDCRKRRIIDQGSLYDDPENFHQNVA